MSFDVPQREVLKKQFVKLLTGDVVMIYGPRPHIASRVLVVLERTIKFIHRKNIRTLYNDVGLTAMISFKDALKPHKRSYPLLVYFVIEINSKVKVARLGVQQQLFITWFKNVKGNKLARHW
jgi:hypothetical protein